MTPRPEEPPEIDEHGDEKHPAFGMATVHRKHGSARPLFQSDLTHSNTIVLSVTTATRHRELKTDYVHPQQELIEIEMSETQWGALVASVGGGGVPVTIRARETERHVPDLPYQPRLAENHREVTELIDRLFERAKKAMHALDQAEDNKAGVRERRELRAELRHLLESASGNAQFAVDSLSGMAAAVITQVQADIEAHLLRSAATHGELAADAARVEPAQLTALAHRQGTEPGGSTAEA